MIDVERLSKTYGSVHAVADISFSVGDGAVVGFLGPNGAGKSTTLRIIAGFLGATRGRVRIAGHDIVEERREALRKIGYMPETSPLYPEMRVAEYLRFRAELKGVGRRERGKEVERVLAEARVDDMADTLIDHLSKGYRQRVGLADALLGSPPLLILDEPSAGLDPNQIQQVRALVRRLADEHTILLSTHILPEVEATCDRAIVIDRGKLVASGTIDELRSGTTSDRLAVVVAGGGGAARRALKKLGVVRKVKPEPTRTETTRLVVRFQADVEPGPGAEAVVAALVGAGIGVRRVEPVAASLEQVFSRLTGAEPDGDDEVHQ
ncbi:MAG TPA: ABC transporter ATP-binding protein [Polyangiaceae bacterium]|nr:ABC transporter ATP-binding protein [Polyangiaceae bacterium]